MTALFGTDEARRWTAIGAAATFLFVTQQVGIAAGAPVTFLVPDTLLGLLFLVAGAIAWRRRPLSATGPILVACAVLWHVGSYSPTGISPWWAIGFAFESYYDIALAWLALTFGGRRMDRWGAFAIGLMAAGFVVRSASRLLFQDPPRTYPEFGDGPVNPFAILENRAAFESVEGLASVVIAVGAVLAGGLAAKRLAGSATLTRAVTAPVIGASVAAMLVAALDAADTASSTLTGFPILNVSEPFSGLVSWSLYVARALVPLAFLLATLRLRAGTGPLRRMSERLAADATPAEVDAALRAYIENEELADLLVDQLSELRASRVRLVAAADDERRRIERALHDGAQQHLTQVAMRLEDARIGAAALNGAVAAQLSDTAAELRDAMQELRELARGIHPAILSEAGLAPALATLARRSVVPVDLSLDLGGRLPTAVEVTIYYVVAEALTNVARNARASRAGVSVSVDGSVARLVVEDDGVGGADPAAGTGLAGLEDRVRAIGGRLSLHSPPGEGTRLEAWLPCG
jgi:signal transduction histidine kinase